MSAIAAHGATQLWFGEQNAALTQGYYADYTRLSAGQEAKLRAYDDFFVRYQTLLFNDSLADVSMTHCGWDNEEYVCSAPYSVCGEGGKLWLILREDHTRKLIILINLCGDESSLWNAGRAAPVPLTNVILRAQVFKPVVSAWTASPDRNFGAVEPIAFTMGQGEHGDFVQMTLPQVERFSILYLETEK